MLLRPPSSVPAHEDQTLLVRNCTILPLQDLPDELISRIFQHYVLACDFQMTPNPIGEPCISYKARSLLCSINHRMREIAIHCPQLWTSFQLLGYPYNYPPRELFCLWAKRSGSLPIHLDCYGPRALSSGHPGKCGSARAIRETMGILHPHLHRWKSFKAFLETPTAITFTSLSLENAVSLNELAVVSSCSQDLNDTLLASIAKLPALQCLTWENYDLLSDEVASFYVAVSCFPWRQLTIISLSVIMSPEETYCVLASSISAEAVYLQIRRAPSPFPHSTPRPLTRLPNLLFLELRTDTSIYEVLRHFDFPGLKVLYISGRRFSCGRPTIKCEEYKDFISRSSASLQYAILDSFDFYGNDVSNFFDNRDLFNIPIFQVWLDDKESRDRAVHALRGILSIGAGVPRGLKALNDCFETYHVGWVDEDVKRFYHSCVLDRYLPSLKDMLELDKVDICFLHGE